MQSRLSSCGMRCPHTGLSSLPMQCSYRLGDRLTSDLTQSDNMVLPQYGVCVYSARPLNSLTLLNQIGPLASSVNQFVSEFAQTYSRFLWPCKLVRRSLLDTDSRSPRCPLHTGSCGWRYSSSPHIPLHSHPLQTTTG